jgi:hypothetical protein
MISPCPFDIVRSSLPDKDAEGSIEGGNRILKQSDTASPALALTEPQ